MKRITEKLQWQYYDISAFNRRFKTYTGMTPQQYKLSSESTAEQAVMTKAQKISQIQED